MHSQPFKLFSCCFLLLSLKTRFWKWHNKASNFVRPEACFWASSVLWRRSSKRLMVSALPSTSKRLHLQQLPDSDSFPCLGRFWMSEQFETYSSAEWICNSSEAFVLPRIRPLSSKSMVSWSRRAFLLLVEFNDAKVASNRNCILRHWGCNSH